MKRNKSARCNLLCLSVLLVASSCMAVQLQAFKERPARPATAAARIAQQLRASVPPAESADHAEQHTAKAMEAARTHEGALYAFLRQMPKGGDLHNHDVGAVYAESWVKLAAESNLCVDRESMALSASPCKQGSVEVKTAQSDPALYARMIDAWSMRGMYRHSESGHDHFFDTFSKFGAAAGNHMGEAFAEITSRAAEGHVQYLELMTTADNAKSIALGSQVGWDPNFSELRKKLLAGGIEDLVRESRHNLDTWHEQKDEILNCSDHSRNRRQAGCEVKVRHIYPVLRAFAPEQVFAQMLLAFELAKQDPRVVAVNLVQPEDWLVPMRDFRLHMRMLNYLEELYPGVHVSLHAGELAPGMVPPEGLRFHIRESIETGRAERIGHGVDVMHEDEPHELLSEMAHRNVMVEICLTSNDGILGVRGKQHPLAMYLKAGVPVALATDDEGVSRSEMTREYERAVTDQGLDYITLKKMARTSLQQAFLPGASLWSDPRRFVAVHECNPERPSNPSQSCQRFLSGSEKAREQWKLEKSFAEFEAKFRDEARSHAD